MSDLPNGWLEVDLNDVAGIVRGVTYKKEAATDTPNEGFVPILRATNITGASLTFDGLIYVPSKNVSTDQFLRHGDVVIASSSGSKEIVGKSGAFSDGNFLGSFGAFCTGVRPSSSLSSSYFGYYFQTPSYRKSVSELSAGSNINNLKTGDLAAQRFHVPPFAEQTRIVAKLEELLSDLDAGVAELKAAQKKLAQYRQSLLEDVSQGTLLGDVHVEETTLGKIVISIGQGWSPKCENHPSESPEQWAVIKTTAIQPLSFDGSHNKELPANLTAREYLELRDGDLLVTRAGPRNRVGITCLVKSPRSKLILCDKAYRLKINEAKALPAFVELVLNSPRALQTIDTLKSGINDSGLNLTQDRFFTLPLNLPTLQVQQLLVNAFADANNEICDFESVIERSLSQAAAQRQNILRAAFAGELVPQDPNDEPASVLLERIRAERAAQAKPKSRGRKKAAPKFEDPTYSG